MLALNIRQEPKKVIFDRFNALNGLQLNPDNFVMGEATEHLKPELNTNTRVLVTPAIDSTGYNSFYIYYNRMELTEVFDRINLEVKTAGAEFLVEILDLINIELGIYITGMDVEDAVIEYDEPLDPSGRGTVEIVTNADCYLYKGSYTLVLNELLNPYDPGIKNAITGIALTNDGVDKHITNINTSVSEQNYFKFLSGVTVNNPPVVKGIKLIDNAIYVFGDFDLDVPATITGSQGSKVYKAVTVNRIGKVIGVDLVAKFDNVFQKDVQFMAKPDDSKFYLADEKKYISGNAAGLYRYNNKGERDNTLVTTGMTLVVDKVLPLSAGFITASVMQTTPKKMVVITRYNENGSINTAMPVIEVSDALGMDIEVQGMVPSYDTTGEMDGFYILLRNIFSQPIVPVLNSNRVYGKKHLNKNNYILPVLKFNMQGIIDVSFNGNIPHANKHFFQPEIGVFEYTRLFSLMDGVIIFNRVSNPITGVYTLVGLRVRRDGSFELLSGTDYFELPMVKTVNNIVQNSNTFLASVTVEELDNNGALVEVQKVIGFDSTGKPTGTFLELTIPMHFNDMVVFKN